MRRPGSLVSSAANWSTTAEGLIRDVLLGVVGAMIGGYLFNLFGASGVTGLNLYSLLVAVIGAVVFLIVYHAIFRRRRFA